MHYGESEKCLSAWYRAVCNENESCDECFGESDK